MTRYPRRWLGLRAVLRAVAEAWKPDDAPTLVRALVAVGAVFAEALRFWRS